MQNYHDTHQAFPYGVRTVGQLHIRDTWMQQILPYIEQQAMYNGYNSWLGMWVMDTPPQYKDAVLPALLCPSDISSPGFGGGGGYRSGGYGFQGNYIMCTGKGIMYQSKDLGGMFWFQSNTRMRDLVDGTSNTLMASESILRGRQTTGGWGGAGGYWGGGRWGSYGFTTLAPPNTTLPDQVYQCKDTTYPFAPCTSIGGSDTARNYSRSYHPAGVVSVMADGSVQFTGDSINLLVYQAMATRTGREALGLQ